MQILYKFFKWYFALDKCNCSRWTTVYWFDLTSLKYTCPDIFSPDIFGEFMKGHSSFLKTNTPFLGVRLDKLHKQNNKAIKGICGAANRLNRTDEELSIDGRCVPDLARMINKFEGLFEVQSETTRQHHDSSPSFQRDFDTDVQKLSEKSIIDLFERNELSAVNNTDVVFHDHIYHST